MTIASFSVPEKQESPLIEKLRQRLSAVGVVSYSVELAGAGEPTLDLDGNTFVGDVEIEDGVNSYVSEHTRSVRA